MSVSPTQGRPGAFDLNYPDKMHSVPVIHTTPYTLRGQTTAQRSTWFALSFPELKSRRLKDTESTQYTLLPTPWVSSPALVSLYHTLLITAMNRPLSQRMPSPSFFWSHMFAGSCSQLCVSILEKESDSSASLSCSSCHRLLSSNIHDEKNFLKM